MRIFLSFILLLGAACTAAAQNGNTPRKLMDRVKPEHLAATTAAAEANRAASTPSPLPDGVALKDFRAIFHTHADDSSHTGGTLPELLADAKTAGLDAVFLGDHFRPPRDYMDGWRGDHEGVLFIPGSEMHGFLLHPDASVMDVMIFDDNDAVAKKKLIEATTAGTGMIFLSHIEARVKHSMAGLTGMEIYNRHADAMDDMGFLMWLTQRMMAPGGIQQIEGLIEQYPDAMFASGCDYPLVYMNKWDTTAATQQVVGIAANDCHHNQVWIIKRKDAEVALLGTIVDKDEDMRPVSIKTFPGLGKLLENVAPGEIGARLDFDPYRISMRNVNTHIFAEACTEPELRKAVLAGHVYVCHEWMAPSAGFFCWLESDGAVAGILGDKRAFAPGQVIRAQYPLEAHTRLLRNGEVVDESFGKAYSYTPTEPGAYRLEGWLEMDGERRIWLYANPIYLDGEG